MARAYPYELEETPPASGDLCVIAIPIQTFRALTDEAARRGVTMASLLQQAWASVLGNGKDQPRLLTEQRPR